VLLFPGVLEHWSFVSTARRLTLLVTAVLAATALTCGTIPAAQASARAVRLAAGPAGIVAAAGDLIDSSTGRQLWSRDLTRSLPIASITKVMTALVVIRAGTLGRQIRVPAAAEAYAREHDAGTAGLHPGDVLTTWQLLEGLLLPSGADAAFTLARAYGPGWPKFVRKMNATARQLGMTGTHFANFDGLPWPTEYTTYSTPRSIMILAAAAMKLPSFAQIVGQARHWIARTKRHHSYGWQNTNLLLGSYRGAIGIKTGFTLGAGYCVLFAARRDGRVLTGVVLDVTNTEPDLRFTMAARLLNWGFRHT
jgi:serine-type D-Ala-D-Ala carboxypeptidase (penicillin-binding protein 5/6)